MRETGAVFMNYIRTITINVTLINLHKIILTLYQRVWLIGEYVF